MKRNWIIHCFKIITILRTVPNMLLLLFGKLRTHLSLFFFSYQWTLVSAYSIHMVAAYPLLYDFKDSLLGVLPQEVVVRAFAFLGHDDLFAARPTSEWMKTICDSALALVPAILDLTHPEVRSIVDDELLVSLAEKMPEMVSIDISGCRGVTHDGIAALIERCDKLSALSLSCVGTGN